VRIKAAPLRGAVARPPPGSALGAPARHRRAAARQQIFRLIQVGPVLRGPSSSASQCPARDCRVKGGPPGRRFAQTLDPAATPGDWGACEEQRGGAGHGCAWRSTWHLRHTHAGDAVDSAGGDERAKWAFVPLTSVGPLRFGMTWNEVVAALGGVRPARLSAPRGPIHRAGR
jgi:hypothetical protein